MGTWSGTQADKVIVLWESDPDIVALYHTLKYWKKDR